VLALSRIIQRIAGSEVIDFSLRVLGVKAVPYIRGTSATFALPHISNNDY
jgi:hypothetical protein